MCRQVAAGARSADVAQTLLEMAQDLEQRAEEIDRRSGPD